MRNKFSVAAHWAGGMDEAGLQLWAADLRRRLAAPRVTLGLVFLTPQFFDCAVSVLDILRVHAQIPLLAGCSSQSLIAGGEEREEGAGLVLALYHLPGAELRATHFTQAHVEPSGEATRWERITGVGPDQTNGWLVFADPFHLDAEAWLHQWNDAYAPIPILGGLASGDAATRATQIYLNGEVFEEGGVAISIGGEVMLGGVISQGCTPIGEPWPVTRSERNVIHSIGNRPAYEVLLETYNALSAEEQAQARGNIFIGLVMNEYAETFHRGDFLIRNLLGGDPKAGSIAIGALPRTGQTVQFHRRDAVAAADDLDALLDKKRAELAGATVYGACLCCCNGRGKNLFGVPNHDAALVQERLGPLGLAGFFCNGEIGPVGARNFLHGYTAALALFIGKG
jgi:small ligand-binding sensory domain FIST